MNKDVLEKDILQWDVKNWSKALHYWDKKVDWSSVETCLELGSREGGLSLWMALKGKQVISSDFEKSEENAGKLHQKYPIGNNIRYQDINALDIPYENYFDIIVFKSVVGGIARNHADGKQIQQAIFNQIYKALKPGGKLLFAENALGSPLHRFFRKRFNKWMSWRYITLLECREFLQAYSSMDLKTTGVLGGFGRNERQKQALGAIDRAFLNKLSPKNWQYILYGMAEK